MRAALSNSAGPSRTPSALHPPHPAWPADPAVIVSFPLDGDADGASLVAWTTTPWTLPSNLALCVHADFDYIKARDPGKRRRIPRTAPPCTTPLWRSMFARQRVARVGGRTAGALPPASSQDFALHCCSWQALPGIRWCTAAAGRLVVLVLTAVHRSTAVRVATGKVYIVLESRLAEIPGAVPKQKKGKKAGADEAAPKGFEVSWR